MSQQNEPQVEAPPEVESAWPACAYEIVQACLLTLVPGVGAGILLGLGFSKAKEVNSIGLAIFLMTFGSVPGLIKLGIVGAKLGKFTRSAPPEPLKKGLEPVP